ncbi:AMP-binding protein [uncultured Bacteroides sp.]|uniref:AMP-binding protein n=1 Tax=uncultured Bacteroides sp. TaxID=162156 RepID=UPI002AA8A89E|nr:AMP-binding protein [uncultured Bacteroides sp.]
MNLKREEQQLILEGKAYSVEAISQLIATTPRGSSPFLEELYLFLKDWFSPSPTITVHTSGSTGTPKQLTVLKEQMMQSARLTCEYLNLQAGDSALLCMPLQYIAGKMMVVRALVAGLNLILRTPSGHPMAEVDTPVHFAAMVPLQVYNSLRVPEEKERLGRIKILLIGGGAIDAALETEIKQLPNTAYSTYGMTETLSHIALRQLNGANASSRYQPFSSVSLSLSADNTLVINAPLVCNDQLKTNDVARLFDDGTFNILGRKDNIINSGGIKVQTEVIEEILRPEVPVAFAITSVPDRLLGEAIVLLMESTADSTQIKERINILLPKYQQPKHIYVVDSIPLTGSGKIDREKCRLLAGTFRLTSSS